MEDFLAQLNESQREAVTYNDGPSLVIAGAGSGKTRVLTYKVAHLLNNGISPYNILALTFTNKAAREMKSRIASIVGEEVARRLWMGTFHSVFSSILRREADKIGYRSDFTVYDAQDSKNLLKGIIKEMALDDKIYKPSQIQHRISSAKNALIVPQQYESNKELIEDDMRAKRPLIRNIYSAYWNRCRTSGAMDFDDLLLYTYLLFREFPETLTRYQNQFRFVLVDEYQDTNAVQHEIVRQLAAEHHRICVVGDDAQSIYSFRGAKIGNILNFKKTYPESKLFKLEQNYRSTKNIVNAANSLITKNKEQIQKEVFSEKHEGEKVQVIGAYSDYEEGYNVASRISEMCMLNHYAYSDFVILYRTNAQSRIFEEALRKRNIPYRIYGGLSFFQRKEVKDVISYFRLITNPDDEEAFKRVINYPARGIGDTTLNKILSAATQQNVSLWQVLSDPLAYNLSVNSGTAAKLSSFRTLIAEFIESNATQNAYELGESLIRQTGLIGELYQDKTPEGLSRIQNVEELINSLYEFVSSRREEGIENVKLTDFLAEIALMTDQDTDKTNDPKDQRLTMMTVHAAKGLEFKNVFIVGLEEDLFPSQMSKTHESEIEEERRLFYVAITRAEENCILTFAKSRFHHGQSRMSSPSRFIKDIDPKYLKLPHDLMIELPSSEHTLFSNDRPAYNRFQQDRPASFRSSEKSYNIRPPWEKKSEDIPAFAPSRKWTRMEKTPVQPTSDSNELQGLQVGNIIKHERFGLGKILAFEGSNDNAKATVEFESFGKKQLLLKFAKFNVIK